MKTKDELKKYRELGAAGIQEELKTTGRELLNLKFRKGVTGIPKSSAIPALKKKIARLKTVQLEVAAGNKS